MRPLWGERSLFIDMALYGYERFRTVDCSPASTNLWPYEKHTLNRMLWCVNCGLWVVSQQNHDDRISAAGTLCQRAGPYCHHLRKPLACLWHYFSVTTLGERVWVTCVFLIEGSSFKELSLALLGGASIFTASYHVRQIKELAVTLCSSSHSCDLFPVGLGGRCRGHEHSFLSQRAKISSQHPDLAAHN